MIRISKHTRLAPHEIIAKAENFFVEKGSGLVAKDRSDEKRKNLCSLLSPVI